MNRHYLFAWLLLIISMFLTTESRQHDISCLRSIKESLQDPNNYLSSWQFETHSREGHFYTICQFTGDECWDDIGSNSVLNINLSGMGLRGEFPRGIANCSYLTGLDLSNNHLYGSIPSDIAHLLPFLTYLNLSHNEISGGIPRDIANCTFLNVLNLDNNRLTGGIPAEVVTLRRLRTFTVANNHLSGPVPRHPYSKFSVESLANNSGLCGYPLDPCESEAHRSSFVNGFIVGWAVFCFSVCVGGFFVPIEMYVIRIKNRIWRIFARHRSLPSEDGTDNTMISMFEKFCCRMNYLELSNATNNFNEENVIARDETGNTYKAILSNGWCLAIKRFHPSLHLEHMFLSEITTLGRIRHKNLVPLIGFFCESNERLIVYKFMKNGTLYDCLFSPNDESKSMEWPLRVRIAVGIAKGIIWLHKKKVFNCRICSNSILLDANFNPCISYMGKAANAVENDTKASWKRLFNRGCPALGSYEEDVYAFGKVLLELITGEKHHKLVNSFERIDGDMVVEICTWPNQQFDDDTSHLLKVADKCLRWNQGKCPSMVEVYQMITGENSDKEHDSLDKSLLQTKAQVFSSIPIFSLAPKCNPHI